MSKLIKIISLTVILVLLQGCGKKDTIINAELARAFDENVTFSEKLTQLDTRNAERRYSLNSKDYSEITAYAGTASTCDEFVIVKTSAPQSMAERLNKYIEEKRSEYEEYRPDEVYKLDSVMLEIYEDAVVMVVINDTEAASEVYKEYLKD